MVFIKQLVTSGKSLKFRSFWRLDLRVVWLLYLRFKTVFFFFFLWDLMYTLRMVTGQYNFCFRNCELHEGRDRYDLTHDGILKLAR